MSCDSRRTLHGSGLRGLRARLVGTFVGHSYGGLVALEAARNNTTFAKIAVYEPGVSIGGSMPTAWMPGYEKKLAENRRLDALVEFTLADAPPRIQKTPRWLMTLLLRVLVSCSRPYRQMLNLLDQNLREWILPHSETKAFPELDHFGIERTAPREVARAVSDYFSEIARENSQRSEHVS